MNIIFIVNCIFPAVVKTEDGELAVDYPGEMANL